MLDVGWGDLIYHLADDPQTRSIVIYMESIGDARLPPHWSRSNPVDILGDASAERYARAVDIVARDPNNDGVLVILTPQAMTKSTETAKRLKPFGRLEGKPILASWMGGKTTDAGEAILNDSDIPTFEYPDTAARAFSFMWRYSHNLRMVYETPALARDMDDLPLRLNAVREAIAGARKHGRTLLTEVESKQILSAYGIPVVESHVAHSAEQTVKIARKLGYPVALKVHSHTITHKSDVGGVKLCLRSAALLESGSLPGKRQG
jgi:acetyltransferase